MKIVIETLYSWTGNRYSHEANRYQSSMTAALTHFRDTFGAIYPDHAVGAIKLVLCDRASIH